MEYFFLGLGNPAGYEGTRHNIGKDFIEGLVSQTEGSWQSIALGRVACISIGQYTIACGVSEGSMNETGDDLRDVLLELEPSRIVVVHDDIAFPVGTIRIASGKGAGGHNGVASVARVLETDQFLRLRIGIGRGNGSIREHVLGAFSPDEKQTIAVALRRSLPTVLTQIFQQGTQKKNTPVCPA